MKIYDLDNVRRVKQKLDKELGQQYFFDLTLNELDIGG